MFSGGIEVDHWLKMGYFLFEEKNIVSCWRYQNSLKL